MPRFQTLTSYLLLVIHTLLVFLLIFQEKVAIPAWLQPVGRMHPMVLHLPIGLIVFVGILWVFRKEFEGINFSTLFNFALSFTALTAAVAALMGFFLSQEKGYTADLLNWHKYTGVVLSFLAYGLVLLYQKPTQQKPVFNAVLALSIVTLTITGHFGASLTHGEDYLFPAQNGDDAPLTITDDTPVFEAAVKPILKAKCFQCHNEQKTKGELLMTSLGGLLKGGKNGPIWVSGDALNSHIIQRANLPLDDKKHMPPKGKSQLTPQEIGILTAWIQGGADVKKPLKALVTNDPLKALLQAFLNKSSAATQATPSYTFEAASESTLEKLNNPFRVIFPIAHGSPALQADFFVRQAYKPEQLGELSEIKNQLVALNLSNMPIKDEDLNTISQLGKLEKLNLNNTDITGVTLTKFKTLSKLKSLSLSGTKVTKETLQNLGKLPNLQEVFVWNTPILEKDLTELKKQYPKIRFELGYVPKESEKIKLNPPMLVNENFVLTDQTPVTFKHPLNGVTIRYTLDGTIPDSTSSAVYQKPILLNSYTVVKARAIKDNWLASDVVEYTFFKGTYRPNLVELLNEPNPQYIGEGGQTLINQKKGEASDFKNKAWLGYREKPFEALFTFTQPVPIKTVTLSIGKNIGGFIFPPTSVEIWGGNSKENLKLLQKIIPEQPTENQPTRIEVIKGVFKESNCSVIKIIAKPVTKLPAWHAGKGQPGWVFIDEVFFN